MPYITANPVDNYADGIKFREAATSLSNGVRGIVSSHVNEALIGFNTRVQNTSIDFNESSITESDVSEYSALLSDYNNRLSRVSDEIMTKVDTMVESYLFNRPLLRPTGERRGFTSINLGGPTTVSYEFKNVGTKPWSGWMVVRVEDEYHKFVVVDYAPPTIPVVAPGESVWLTREITVPKVVYVDGNPRTWGKNSKIRTSIYTRNVK